MQQQNVNAGQEFANNALQKQIERNRTAVLKSDSKTSLKLMKMILLKKKRIKKHERKKERESSKQTQHPFKGHFVDFSG